MTGQWSPALPEPSELTATWWAACNQGRLLVQECGACARRWFTPELICIHCGSARWEWAESSGRGTVYSLTVVHRGAGPGFVTPYVIAIVDLDDGWSILSNLVAAPPDRWQSGDRVQVRFDSVGTRLVPAFEPEVTA